MNAKRSASLVGIVRSCPIVVVISIVLCSCTPWTVRPLNQDDQSNGALRATAGNANYVTSIWDAKLVPTLMSSAIDARTLLNAMIASEEIAEHQYGRNGSDADWYFMVKGEGKVLSVDTRSRTGVLLVDIPPFDHRADVSIQIGPVLRGTALRDATGLIRFSDFVNQLDFADVANDLNDRASKEALSRFDARQAVGQLITFAGAFSPSMPPSQPPISNVVPVRLALEKQP